MRHEACKARQERQPDAGRGRDRAERPLLSRAPCEAEALAQRRWQQADGEEAARPERRCESKRDGRPEDRGLALALDELKFFSEKLEILGVYPADPFRSR